MRRLGKQTLSRQTPSKLILPMILSLAVIIALTPIHIYAASEVIRQGPGDEPQVALTFDDGYAGHITDDVLDVLGEYGVAATFFLNGEAIEDHPEQARRVVDEGHELANHSHTHRDFTGLSSEEIFQELQLTEDAALAATGQEISRLFRAPYGSFNQEVLNLVGEAGYAYTIQWTIDTLDWQGPSPETIYDRVISDVEPGAIVLLHVNHEAVNTAAALPGIIEELTAQGYEFVTVSEMIFGTDADEVHIVQSGETLNDIANQYDTTIDALVEINDLEDPDVIYERQELYLPEGEEPEPEPEP